MKKDYEVVVNAGDFSEMSQEELTTYFKDMYANVKGLRFADTLLQDSYYMDTTMDGTVEQKIWKEAINLLAYTRENLRKQVLDEYAKYGDGIELD